ncbi:MAG TPA: universal stress protein [Ramlibacter sp.]|uniref:universal stress protein n=1 Tax=Ramlibacter sp. TaxID=1917967 RepID=UPI002D471685|nr:universal stress protein [Ramlibacter sp.]HZY18730.1 universal stress protein [Ramlibacter sp.]
MGQLLVPLDGSIAQRERALAEAIRLHRHEAAGICLLSVQPPVNGHVAGYFSPSELERLQRDAGREELAPAETLLEAAGVPFRSLVRTGRRAETIARTAQELACDRILLDAAQGDTGRRWLGSVAQQVRHILQSQHLGRFVTVV